MRNVSVIYVEWLVLLLVTPFLMFPTVMPRLTALALIVLAGWWLFRALRRREVWPVTPFNGVLLLFAVLVLLSAIISSLPELTLPKVTNLILGLATFRAVVWTVSDRRWLFIGVLLLLLLGLGMIFVGLLSVSWSVKVPLLYPWLQRLPHTHLRLPELSEQRGVNPNQLGGVLSFYVPLVVGLLGYNRERTSGLSSMLGRLFLGGLAFFALIVLVLTQSRSGWLGAGLGILVVAGGRVRDFLPSKWRWRVVVGLFVAGVIGGVFYAPPLLHVMRSLVQDAVDDGIVSSPWGKINVMDRVEIWAHDVYILRDFPLTGLGLGTFRRMIRILYPFAYLPSTASLYHAHNVFLHAGTDLGFPGLVVYTALVLLGFWSVVYGRRGSPEERRVVYSVGVGFLGYHVYGLTDTLSLGSKPALLFWMALGLLAAVARMIYGAYGAGEEVFRE